MTFVFDDRATSASPSSPIRMDTAPCRRCATPISPSGSATAGASKSAGDLPSYTVFKMANGAASSPGAHCSRSESNGRLVGRFRLPDQSVGCPRRAVPIRSPSRATVVPILSASVAISRAGLATCRSGHFTTSAAAARSWSLMPGTSSRTHATPPFGRSTAGLPRRAWSSPAMSLHSRLGAAITMRATRIGAPTTWTCRRR